MNPKIAFIHIPKTAGSSVRSSLLRYFGDEVAWDAYNSEFGPFYYYQKQLRNSSILGGHKRLSYFPKSGSTLFFSMVRNPLDRAISLFSYYAQPQLAATSVDISQRKDLQAKWIKRGLDPTDILKTIKECKQFRAEITNQQCSFLSYRYGNFNSVMRSINKNDFIIGSLDSVDVFEARLCELLGLPLLNVRKINSSTEGYRDEIKAGSEVESLIAELNQEDYKLYNYVKDNNYLLDTVVADKMYKKIFSSKILLTTSNTSDNDKKHSQAEKLWRPKTGQSIKWPAASFMFSQRHKVLYLPVAKCGCTSLKTLMLDLAEVSNRDEAKKIDVHFVTDTFDTGVQLNDAPVSEAKSILRDDGYFKFAVLRDPFDRLVSAYLEKFVYNRMVEANQAHTKSVLRLVYGSNDVDYKRGVTFTQFVETILKQEPESLDSHWTCQSRYLNGVDTGINIYRLDQLDLLQDKLSVLVDKNVIIAHRNKTKSGNNVDVSTAAYNEPLFVDLLPSEIELKESASVDQFLDESLVKEVKRYYQTDYQLLAATDNNFISRDQLRTITSSMGSVFKFDLKNMGAKIHLYTKGIVGVKGGKATKVNIFLQNQSNFDLDEKTAGPLSIGCRVKNTAGETLLEAIYPWRIGNVVCSGSSSSVQASIDMSAEQYEECSTLEFSLVDSGGVWINDLYPLHACWVRVLKSS